MRSLGDRPVRPRRPTRYWYRNQARMISASVMTMTAKRLDLDREEYFAERRLLIEARQRAYQRADQMIIGGAAGALILSIGFVEKLAPGPAVTYRWMLANAWLILLLGLAFALGGQYAAGKAFDAEIAKLDAAVNGERPPKNRWARWTVRLSGWSFAALIIGIGCLAWFAFANAAFNRG